MREQALCLMRNSKEKERLLLFIQFKLQSQQQLAQENSTCLVANILLKDEVASLKN